MICRLCGRQATQLDGDGFCCVKSTIERETPKVLTLTKPEWEIFRQMLTLAETQTSNVQIQDIAKYLRIQLKVMDEKENRT